MLLAVSGVGGAEGHCGNWAMRGGQTAHPESAKAAGGLERTLDLSVFA